MIKIKKAELYILLYLCFSLSLFFVSNLKVLLYASSTALCILIFSSNKKFRSGVIPITIFLLVTFLGNLFFHSGKIVFVFFGAEITEEGVYTASTRTIRVFLLIFGAKLVTINCDMETLLNGAGNLLKPLEKIGVPVKGFMETTALSLSAFPLIKDKIKESYEEKADKENVGSISKKIKLLLSLILPIFISSLKAPEKFFTELKERKKS